MDTAFLDSHQDEIITLLGLIWARRYDMDEEVALEMAEETLDLFNVTQGNLFRLRSCLLQ